MIELTLANGKTVRGTAEEIYWFYQTDGRSITAPVPDKVASTIKVSK